MDEVDRIIHLLDFEIDRLRSETQRPGWSRWALAGAMGTCLWLLSSDVGDRSLLWVNVAGVFVLGSVVCDVACWIWLTVRRREEGEAFAGRFDLSSGVFREARFFAVWALVRMGAVLVLAYWMLLPRGVWVALCVWYGVEGLVFVAALGASFWEVPIPIGRRKEDRGIIAVVVIVLGWGLVTVAGVGQTVWARDFLSSVYEVRSGVLLVAIVTLAGFLVRPESKLYLAGNLVAIRRDLALGRMDLESAKEQVDVALAGLTIDKMLQKEVSEVLGHLRAVSSEMEQVSKEHAIADEIIGRGASAEENEVITAERLTRSCESRVVDTHKRMVLAAEGASRIERKVRRLRLVAPECVDEVKVVTDKIAKASESLGKKMDSLRERMREGERAG